MALTEDQISKVAHLARLEIPPEQIPGHAQKLSSILDYIEQMNAIDTTGIEPMSHPLNITQPTRTDEITEANQRELMQTIAPNVENGLYLVPKVIE